MRKKQEKHGLALALPLTSHLLLQKSEREHRTGTNERREREVSPWNGREVNE